MVLSSFSYDGDFWGSSHTFVESLDLLVRNPHHHEHQMDLVETRHMLALDGNKLIIENDLEIFYTHM